MAEKQNKVNKVVIIGGSASGAACGARLRRLDENLKIVIFEKTANASYASCGMPYHLGNEIKDRNDLLITPVPLLTNTYNFDLRLQHEVMKILPDKKEVLVINKKTNKEFSESYDRLILCMGASTFFPPIPGIRDTKHIFKLENLNDMDLLKKKSEWSEKCVILGGGFIGIEVAEQLQKLGVEVTIIEILPQILAAMDMEMARYMQKELKKNGINVMLNSGVKKFSHNTSNDLVSLEIETKTKDGDMKKTVMNVDMVLISTGVRPSSKIAVDCGIKCNKRGAIIVNEHLQTSNNDIYACGDLIEVKNAISGMKSVIPLANLANMHGRMVANAIYGLDQSKFTGAIGTSIIKAYSLTACVVGLPEHFLKRNNIDYIKYYNADGGRPSYMPYGDVGYRNMIMKMMINKDGKILGFQCIGKSGVDVIGNVIATTCSFNKKITDLIDIELPYCPFSGHARSIANMLGIIAKGIFDGTHRLSYMDDVLKDVKEKKVTLIDVRPVAKYKKFHIPSSINIPLTKFRNEMGKLKKDGKYVFVCGIGKMGYWITRIAILNGFKDVSTLSGGCILYKRCYHMKK